MLNKDQRTGILERVLYSLILAAAMELVKRGYMSPDMATYVAAGGVGAIGSAYAWWINRPTALLNAASAQLPKNASLVITTPPDASRADKVEAAALASAANEKVTSKTM